MKYSTSVHPRTAGLAATVAPICSAVALLSWLRRNTKFKREEATVSGEQPILNDATPANQAASYILDRVAERKGIIIVPEEPWTDMWKRYILGDQQMEELGLREAHNQRIALEKSKPWAKLHPR